jgi:uncharacterized tellurite resistance protein B-like protein
MINKIKEFFNKKTQEAEDNSHSVLNVATAALLIEVMTIDGNMDQEEMDSVKSNLSKILELSDDEIQELIDLSQEEVSDATSLYQFTKEINANFELQQKLDLMTALWQVALADDYLDKYEESILRKIADLIHLRHSEYIECKSRARTSD